MRDCETIEKSIIKKYRKTIWTKFIASIKEYDMLSPGDKIGVCISGGKDSMLLAKCFQQLQKHSDFPFELAFIVMDPGYNPENRKIIEDNAKHMNIPIEIFETKIFGIVDNMEGSPCYMCARMRRGYLYKFAKSLGCNKIALGHHFDDVIETMLLSMLYGAEMRTMMPKLHSTNYEGMELIRPLYFVKEADILSWVRYNELSFIQCACRFTENLDKEHTRDSKRKEMKELIKHFREINPNIDMNILSSANNVNLDTLISYRKGDEIHSFLDDY